MSDDEHLARAIQALAKAVLEENDLLLRQKHANFAYEQAGIVLNRNKPADEEGEK
jgi:hypothetical protein